MKVFRSIIMILFLGIKLISCGDYVMFVHFYVEQGKGELMVETTPIIIDVCEEVSWCELDCPKNSQIITIHSGKGTIRRELTFRATPDEGYKVKEWLYNGEKITDNTTEVLNIVVTSEEGYDVAVTVVFEEILN